MGNFNTQSPVPLAGIGFVAKEEDSYEPGEYAELVNAEISSEGKIINRRCIDATGSGATEEFDITNPNGFLGVIGSYAIVGSKTQQYAVNADNNYVMWVPTDLPVPAAAGSFHVILKVIEYGDRWHWVTLKYDAATFIYKFYVYHRAEPSWIDNPGSITFASLTAVEVLSTTFTTGTGLEVRSIFVHKDRLWITTDSTIYFSKATDFTVFTVPDGGFIGIADQVINHSFSLGDSIYILGDDSVYLYTYSVDPNDDAYLRPISSAVGGLYGTVHQNTPYMINKEGIYSITNGNIEKVHDALFDVKANFYRYKIESFADYLIIIKTGHATYNATPPFTAFHVFDRGPAWAKDPSNRFNYNLYFFNVTNGSTHAVDFTDANDVVNVDHRGYVVDILPNYNKDSWGENHMYLLTNRYVSGAGPYVYKGSTYKMRSFNPREFVYDAARLSTNVVKRYKHRVVIEIEGFVPDGNEYLMKKFRNLLLMGKFPDSDFKVQVALNNEVYRAGVPLVNTLTTSRSPSPARLGINQRGRSISIRLYSDNHIQELTTYDWDKLQIEDIRLLWSYTQRLPVHPSETAANLGRDY